MPSVLIAPYLLRGQQGKFRDVLVEAGFELIDPEGDFALTASELRTYLPKADAMLAGGERMTSEILAIAPRLRVIARTGVGYDLIDLQAACNQRIAVTITPGTNQESVAEQTLALLLALARKIVSNNQVIHTGGWDRRLVAPVRGKTLGLLGLGRIGRAVASRALAFEMKVVAYDPVVVAGNNVPTEIECVSLDQLLSMSDYVSLHLPLSDATRGMVNREFLAKMRLGSSLLNTARGGLVVESDLVESLKSGHLAGAGLDVLCHEPPEPGNPLLGMPNVILCPHIAGTDTKSMSDMAELAARTIVDLYNNRWPSACVVNQELQETWRW
jgi:D-3-phosphoglycerate dehydrogenase / 2-oxoglutarate reductase